MQTPTTFSRKELLKECHPLIDAGDLDPLMDRIGDAHYVLLGEATHGTHEYYTWRTAISKRLILEKGFSFIAVEGDWPACSKVNRWIKGYPDAGGSIREVLRNFDRWPAWMWANWEVVALAQWLKDHNDQRSAGRNVGFYGLDVYSLWESMELIVKYLEKEDPKAARLARRAIDCFEPYGEDQDYAMALSELEPSCQDEVVRLLHEIRRKAPDYDHDPEARLNAEMNALVAVNGEEYYRSMATFGGRSWNVRDQHMVETLNSLMDFHGPDAKVIVWAHNSHIGDARATSMQDHDLVNVGQLVREQHGGNDVVLIGFGSHEGKVIAGRAWGAIMQEMEVPPALITSVEGVLHEVSPDNKLLIFGRTPALQEHFGGWAGHRAIGVVFEPEKERANYVPTKLTERYDAFLYLDSTQALHPLHFAADSQLLPDTYPFGL